MTKLQKAGGIAALAAAATYLFALSLVATVLAPMANQGLAFGDFIAFLHANVGLVFLWHFVMYFVNGVCLVILVLALYERQKESSPALAKVAAIFGLIWTSFVFLSGLITNYGLDTVLSLSTRNMIQAEALKTTIETITLGIDSSDRFLGCLWVGLASAAALKTGALPKPLSILGLAIGSLGIIGASIPALLALSYVFGVGVIAWWIGVGIVMLRGGTAATIGHQEKRTA